LVSNSLTLFFLFLHGNLSLGLRNRVSNYPWMIMWSQNQNLFVKTCFRLLSILWRKMNDLVRLLYYILSLQVSRATHTHEHSRKSLKHGYEYCVLGFRVLDSAKKPQSRLQEGNGWDIIELLCFWFG
jgi:hypothetical protein